MPAVYTVWQSAGILMVQQQLSLFSKPVVLVRLRMQRSFPTVALASSWWTPNASSSLTVEARQVADRSVMPQNLCRVKTFGVRKVPPLRVRPADIADMAVYFSRQLAKRTAVRQMGLTSGAVRQLESYDFPNNIQVDSLNSAASVGCCT